MSDLQVAILAAAVIYVIVVSCVVGVCYAAESWRCGGIETAYGMETFMAGGSCYVKSADGVVPADYVFGKYVEVRITANGVK